MAIATKTVHKLVAWYASQPDATPDSIADQLTSLATERAAIQTRQSELVDNISRAYGSNTSELESEYARLTARLQALAQIETRLRGEQADAIQRQHVNEHKALVSDFENAVAGLKSFEAGELVRAENAYNVAVAKSHELRGQVIRLQSRIMDDLQAAGDQNTIKAMRALHEAIAADLQTIWHIRKGG